jgi:hypothetical protein
MKLWRQNETLSGILPARSVRVPKRERKTGTEDRDRVLGSMIEQEPGSTGACTRGCLCEQESWVASTPPARFRIKTRTGKANGNQPPELHTGDKKQNEIWRQTDTEPWPEDRSHRSQNKNRELPDLAEEQHETICKIRFFHYDTHDYSSKTKSSPSSLPILIIRMKIYSWHTNPNLVYAKW